MTSKEALMLLINSTKPSIWKDEFRFRNLKTNEEKTAEEIFNIIYNDLSRLEQLDGIKEKLGIDLITLIKALNGLYYKIRLEDRKISKMKVPMLRIIDGEYCWICPKWMTTTWMSVKVKDYGKTWSLTEEELEKLNNK